MKVLYISAEPYFVIKGCSISIRNTLIALTEANYKVDFLGIPEGHALEMANCAIFRTPRIPGRWPSTLLTPLCMLIQACWMCRRNRYDVAHALGRTGWIGAVLKRLFGVHFVYDLGGRLPPQTGIQRAKKDHILARTADRIAHWTLDAADLVRTASDKMADSLGRAENDTIVVIEDAPLQMSFQPDPDGAVRLREEFNIATDQVVVYTGSFSEEQGVDMLIRAARQVAQQVKDVCFLLVGGEPDTRARMEYLANSLDIADKCIFAGSRPVEEIPACMTLAVVLVSPRLSGGATATKLLTYMQSGKPIVATRIPSHTSLLDDSCAVLVRAQPENLAEGIMQVFKEPLISDALGKDALARVAEKYSLASFKHKIRKAYQDMLAS